MFFCSGIQLQHNSVLVPIESGKSLREDKYLRDLEAVILDLISNI